MPTTSSNARILVVDDSIFICMALEALCDSLGWQLVGPATSIAAGLHLAAAAAIDAALLDVSLGEEKCWEIAARLQERGIPFAFITGHDLTDALPPRFANTPLVRKPFRSAVIEPLVRQMLASLRG
ncbi:MAG: response regulator [Sphingomonadales bacterium]|jgi:CheY-like chemotaxis protein